MTDLPSRAQPSPSPKIGPPVLPPLSKFYCGPTQGWHSTEPSPNQNESTWTLGSPHGSAASPQVRLSPVATSQSSNPRHIHGTRDAESPQTWRNPSPSSAFHMKQNAELNTPAAGQSTLSANQGWDSRPNSSSIDNMTWSVASGRIDVGNNDSDSPPPVPDLPGSGAMDQGTPSREQSLKRLSPSSKYSSQHYSVRGSATTIDVPLFLQPPLFDPETAPPLPGPPMIPEYPQSTSNVYSSMKAQPLSQHFTLTSGSARPVLSQDSQDQRQQSLRDNKIRETRRPKFDPQNSLKYGHMKQGSGSSVGSAESLQRPRFDPQNSHESIGLSNSWHTKDHSAARKHSKPPFQSSLHREHQEHNLQQDTTGPRQQTAPPFQSSGRIDSSVNVSRIEPGPDHAYSTESQQNALQPPDGRSMTATDASSYVPATSTPESHETTNTSLRGSEPQNDTSLYDEESNDSFYWHSGRSSSEDDEDRNGEALGKTSGSTPQNKTPKVSSDHYSTSTARDNSVSRSVTVSRHSRSQTKDARIDGSEWQEPASKNEVHGHPTRSSSLSPNPAISYTASALGIGGPSDWEYFGDYEAEEIDDEDLYSHKPRAELPANHSDAQMSDYGLSGALEHGSEIASKPQDSGAMGEDVNDSVSLVLKPLNDTPEDGNLPESRWSPSTTPTTPHANSSRPITVTSEPLPEDHRPDLDDVIRAWSDSPHVGRISSLASGKHTLVENSDNRGDPTEASLASSPGENVLGIYSIPKDAPPIPRLPDTIDLNMVTASLKELKEPPSLDGRPKESVKEALETPSPPNRNSEIHVAAETATSDSVDAPAIDAENTSSDVQVGQGIQEEHASFALIGDPATKLAQQPEEKAVWTGEPARSIVPGISIPSSDFARKRQLFESSKDKAIVPPNIPRKPLRDIKAKMENSPIFLRQKVSMASLADRPFVNGSTPPSASGSFQSSQLVSPSISRIASHEMLATSPKSGTRSTLASSGASETALVDDSTRSLPSPIAQTSISNETEQIPSASVDEGSQHSHTKQEQLTANDADRTQVNSIKDPHFKCRDPTDPVQQDASSTQSFESENLPHPDPTTTSSVGESCEPVPAQVNEDPEKVPRQNDGPESAITNQGPASQGEKPTIEAINGESHSAIASDTLVDKYGHPNAEEMHQEADPKAVSDPYADLDPWGRASLNRFAAMLREEARAEANKDKLNIFNVFTSRESRLRLVLYGTEDEILNSPSPSQSAKATLSRGPSQKAQHLAKAASTRKAISKHNTVLKQQRDAKELPPLPPNRDSIIDLPKRNSEAVAVDSHKSLDGGECRAQVQSESKESRTHAQIHSQPQSAQGSENAVSEPKVDKTSLSSQPPIFGEGSQAGAVKPLSSQSSDIVHARLNDRDGEVKNYLTNRRSIYRPFATQTAESIEHATQLSREPDLSADVPALPTSQTSEADLAATIRTDATVEPQPNKPLDLRRFIDADFDPLVLILPSAKELPGEPPQLEGLKNAMDAIPDEFSFIHACVVSWDAKVKIQRDSNDRERHLRQMGSEQRIDALFDDHEIGYGDIAELEGEFKQAEAAKKAEEDRSEYHAFVEDVFNVVWTRLNFEMDQLKPHYEQYTHLMDGTLAGKDIFDKPESLSLAPTMTAFLGLHQKLEIRHQKAFEAVLERDRRLKKTEISPWYSLSNLDKVKQLEKQFEDAEKQAIINYCEQRAARANKLMDVLDQNTLRGVGANQDYMEAIMKAVRRIAAGRAFASLPGVDGPTVGIDLVEKAKTVTSFVARSSEQIVQTFHVADMLLNNADFEVSVAKVKVAKADTATLNRLREERAKEDQKLMRDLEHRLALIREDNRRTNDEIVKLMLFLGLQNGKALSAQPAPPALGVKQKETDGPENATTAGAQQYERNDVV